MSELSESLEAKGARVLGVTEYVEVYRRPLLFLGVSLGISVVGSLIAISVARLALGNGGKGA